MTTELTAALDRLDAAHARAQSALDDCQRHGALVLEYWDAMTERFRAPYGSPEEAAAIAKIEAILRQLRSFYEDDEE